MDTEENISYSIVNDFVDLNELLKLQEIDKSEMLSEIDDLINFKTNNNDFNSDIYVCKEPSYYFQNLLLKISESKTLDQFKENLSKFILGLIFCLNANSEFIPILMILNYFLSNSKIKELTIDLFQNDNEKLETMFIIQPKFLHYLINIFNYKSFIIENRKKISEQINSKIEKINKSNNIFKLKNIVKYIIFFYKIYKDEVEIINKYKEEINIRKILIYVFQSSKNKEIDNYLLENILEMYSSYINEIIDYYITNQINIKFINKIIQKNNYFPLLSETNYNSLLSLSKQNIFKFYINQLQKNENRLINIYDLFIDDNFYFEELIKYCKKYYDKYTYNLLLNKNYNEINEYNKDIIEEEKKYYLFLPSNIIIQFISNNKDIDFLDNFASYNLIGIDSEWKPSLEPFDDPKPKASIIQIACKDYIAILDCNYFLSNQVYLNKFIEIFKNKSFIGFDFGSDIRGMDNQLKNFFLDKNKCKLIEIINLYEAKNKKHCPNLNKVCIELFGKGLNKKDRISNWLKRPLRKNQINYGALDSYILLQVYDELNKQ